MPFGTKPDPAGKAKVDFDAIYEEALAPGIIAAGMVPLRADEERLGGVIHRAMFERLLLCDFAVADLTTANPNVLYELGIRHAARPHTTLTVYASRKPLPFDVAPLRTQPYDLTARNILTPEAAAALRDGVRDKLRELRRIAHTGDVTDSPLFQLIADWRPEQLPAAAAPTFAEQVRAGEAVKARLQDLRQTVVATGASDEARAALAAVHAELRGGYVTDLGVHTEVMLAYRAMDDWTGMIDTYHELPAHLRRQVLVRQLVAFAYNRRAENAEDPADPRRGSDRQAALRLLHEMEAEQGPTSETCGLRGRIHKAVWLEAVAAGDEIRAEGLLTRALDAYLRGFEIDWRDYYPGINALTLLDARGTDEALAAMEELMPVVRFALTRSAATEVSAGYWVPATRLELAVLGGDPAEARAALGAVLASGPEQWQRTTTAANLRIIRDARARRGVDVTDLNSIIRHLET
ncbi:TRAFs-binding domain-containing protein [Virgisporangium aurantiacum]|nr:TRAFs-binding domain-containing protein [Virgisporangium aurantiacum]